MVGGADDIQITLRPLISLGGGHFPPVQGLRGAAFDAAAFVIGYAQVGFATGVALLRGFAVPVQSLGLILGNSLAVVVSDPQIVFGAGIALQGRFSEPVKSFLVVLDFTLAAVIGVAEMIFCRRTQGLWLRGRNALSRSCSSDRFMALMLTGLAVGLSGNSRSQGVA